MSTRPLRLLLGIALAGTALAALPAGAAGAGAAGSGSFTSGYYPAQGAPGARQYWLYVPPGHRSAPRPVVGFLHGCNQTAVQAAAATRLDELADQRDFVVVYPQQNVTAPSTAPLADGNGIGCWNWFLPADQVRGSGEASTIAGLAQWVVDTEHGDPRRVYVEGISAGADMSVILAAAYPDVFAAAGVIAGCAYAACADATGRLAYEAMGPRARLVPLFVENGSADTVNPLPLAAGLVQSWLGVDSLVETGSPVSPAVPRTPAATTTYGFGQTPAPGSGDLCIHNDSWTCPGGAIGFRGSYPYSVSHFTDAGGCDLVDLWAIYGMEHAYPDSPGDGPYTDPLGPDVTQASVDFFLSHQLGDGCPGRGHR
ncbi:MAG TPA: PHB depolymerase family esterase [Mycobacteriales bacterium]|nr:PHB depolymerase family esterase [Mycobacteriales bacterium]